ncbi:6753_t:CDS:2 [Funneliformis geosporum]|uniref:6753_t:CDS:1 n=1 Tax=Funneliformis geosporum TaxID=1117311 RepID=A0A9W4SPF9_9GLOM|nr:6753_t:CDS:2 [Funneliformis geosporum]
MMITLIALVYKSALPSQNSQLDKRTNHCLHKRDVLGKRTNTRVCSCALAESVFDGTSGPVNGIIIYAQDECGSTTITGLFSSGFEDTSQNYTFKIVDNCGKVLRDVTKDLNIQFSEGGSKAFKSKVDDINLNCAKDGILLTKNSRSGLTKRTCDTFSKRQAPQAPPENPNSVDGAFMRINRGEDSYAQANIFEI